MAPLLAQLKLRSSLYDDPNSHLDQATLNVQQATDATDSQVSVNILQKAVKRLRAAAEGDANVAAVTAGGGQDPVRMYTCACAGRRIVCTYFLWDCVPRQLFDVCVTLYCFAHAC